MSFIPQLPNDWLQTQAQQFKEAQRQGQEFIGVEIQQDRDPDISIPIVYGLQRVEGPILYISTKQGDSTFLYMAVCLSEGVTGPIYRLFVDDRQVFFPTSSNVNTGPLLPGVATLPLVQDRLRPGVSPSDELGKFEYHNGAATQTFSTLLQEIYAPSTMPRPPIYPNTSYLVCRFLYRDPIFKDLPKVTVDFWGIQTRNVGSWNGSTFSATLVNSLNPVDHLLDYLTNENYGAGLPLDVINMTSFKAVYDYLEATRLKQVSTDTGWSIMPSSLTLDSNESILDNVNALINTFGMILSFGNGKYSLTFEGRDNTYTDITDSWIVSEVSIKKPDSQNKYNEFTVDFTDVSNNFIRRSVTWPRATSNANTFINQDGGRKKTGRLSATGVAFPWQARQVAKRLFLKSRSQDVYEFVMVKEAYKFTPGDILRVTTTLPSLTNQLMRIVSMNIQDDFTISVTCVRHNNDYYPPFADVPLEYGSTQVFPPNSPLPAPLPAPNPPTPGPTPNPGDPGAPPPPIPSPPINPALPTIDMNPIRQPFNTLSAAAPTAAWPQLKRGATTNPDWYLGKILKQTVSATSTWAPKYGTYAYTLPQNGATGKLEHTFWTNTTGGGYSFGIQADINRNAVSKQTGMSGGGSFYSFRMSPMITYRYQGEQPSEISTGTLKGTAQGRYKGSNYLLFVYSLSLDGSFNPKTFGWQRDLPGNNLGQYICDLENTEEVQFFQSGSTKPIVYHWRDVEHLFPRLFYNANTNGQQGGFYGGIMADDGRSCVQWVAQTAGFTPTNRPGIDASFPYTYPAEPSTASGSANKMIFKVFSIVDTKPEYLGFVEASTWLAQTRVVGGLTNAQATTNWGFTGRTTVIPTHS